MFGVTKNVLRKRGGSGEAQRGFTMPELVTVIGTVGVLLTPILAAVDTSMGAIRAEQSEVALETARDALIMYAAANDGCLPFAADWEGGLPNTDQTGAPGYTDTGVAKDNTRAGDLPWADLGLSESFRDGDALRIQYYVASQYADLGDGCAARALGAEWNPMVTYQGTVSAPLYVYYTPPGATTRGLYKIDATLPAGTRPDNGFLDVGAPLPASLLELRRGPDINKNGSENDVLSAQNVFVLIATGDNINTNASINLPYMRDHSHRASAAGVPWNLNQNVVDDSRFSATHEFDADQGRDDDDMLMVTSFLSFKSDLRTFGVHLEPVCETAC